MDFFIKINNKFIGLQIKPVGGDMQLPEIFIEAGIQAETHKEFTQKFGGAVFYIYSKKIGDKKEIVNTEVIEEIKKEIERLEE